MRWSFWILGFVVWACSTAPITDSTSPVAERYPPPSEHALCIAASEASESLNGVWGSGRSEGTPDAGSGVHARARRKRSRASMIVIINGAFGIGKTTAARRLYRRVPNSVILDPEHLGWLLQRVPRLVGRRVGDFQDLALWRAGVGLQAGLWRLRAPTVWVPMAFSSQAYFDELRRGFERWDADVRAVCLCASHDVVLERLRGRGTLGAWVRRRSRECCEAHADSDAFGFRIDTEALSPSAVVEAILERCG